MNPSRESRDAVVSPLPNAAPCNQRLTAAVVDWRTRLSGGEDWRILQTEILGFAHGDREVLLALFEIAQRYDEPGRSPVVAAPAGRSPRRRPARTEARRRPRAPRSVELRHPGHPRRRSGW